MSRESQAITRLINEFGAEVMVSVIDKPEWSVSNRVLTRATAAARVGGCDRCGLHAACTAPVEPQWPTDPRAPARFAVVGDWAGPEEDRRGVPFQGRAGKMLRSALLMVGLDEEEGAYTNAVSCMPTEQGVFAPATAEQQSACHANLVRSLTAADTRHVLLLGAGALRAWRQDVRITDVAGKWGVMKSRWFVYPMWHPNAVLRQSFDAREWREQLARFAQGVHDGIGTEALHRKCIECDGRVWAYDPDGLPWCQEHAKFNESIKQESKRNKREHGQQGMGI